MQFDSEVARIDLKKKENKRWKKQVEAVRKEGKGISE